MSKLEKHRGGSRKGAGRKDPVTKKRVNFTLSFEVVSHLSQEGNQSALVESLLRKHYRMPNRLNDSG